MSAIVKAHDLALKSFEIGSMQNETQWLPLFSGTAPDSWRARHKELFPSDESLRHYFRQHKRELVQVGAVVFHRGQFQATDRMLPTVQAIAQRRALRVVEGA
jgi:hypothetical protein